MRKIDSSGLYLETLSLLGDHTVPERHERYITRYLKVLRSQKRTYTHQIVPGAGDDKRYFENYLVFGDDEEGYRSVCMIGLRQAHRLCAEDRRKIAKLLFRGGDGDWSLFRRDNIMVLAVGGFAYLWDRLTQQHTPVYAKGPKKHRDVKDFIFTDHAIIACRDGVGASSDEMLDGLRRRYRVSSTPHEGLTILVEGRGINA